MKKTLKILGGIVAVLLVLLIILITFLDGIVEKSFNSAVPAALGVPASLQSASVRPFRGYVRLEGLHIGNPEGYKTDSLFDLKTLEIKLQVSSLWSDTIVIEKILVDGMELTFEKSLKSSNLGALIDQLAGDEDKEEEAQDEKDEVEDEEPGKKVIIEELLIPHAQMKFSMTGAMGAAIPIPLPEIKLTDLGKESEGVSPVEAVSNVLGAILKSAINVIAGSGKLIGQGVGAAVEGVGTVGKAAGDVVGDVGQTVGDVGKNVGKGVGQAGKAVGNTLKNINPFGKKE